MYYDKNQPKISPGFNAAIADRTVGRVELSATRLHAITSDLAVRLDALETRLELILPPANPSGCSTAGEPMVAPSPLADQLERLENRLEGIMGRVRDLTERVDL